MRSAAVTRRLVRHPQLTVDHACQAEPTAVARHWMADFDAGRVAIEQDAAGLALEDRQQSYGEFTLAAIGVDGRGQLALDVARHCQQFGFVAAGDHERGRTKDLFLLIARPA
jgi:hypothetical protein